MQTLCRESVGIRCSTLPQVRAGRVGNRCKFQESAQVGWGLGSCVLSFSDGFSDVAEGLSSGHVRSAYRTRWFLGRIPEA